MKARLRKQRAGALALLPDTITNVRRSCRDTTGTGGNLIVYLTSKCNMDCTFCIATENRKCVDVKQDQLLSSILEALDTCAVRGISWHGGEPLLKFDFLVKIVGEIRQKYPDIRHGITTNGSLLVPSMLPLLNSLDNVAVSVDGYQHSERPLMDLVRKRKWGIFRTLAKMDTLPMCNVLITNRQLESNCWYEDIVDLITSTYSTHFCGYLIMAESGNQSTLSVDQMINLVFGFKRMLSEVYERTGGYVDIKLPSFNSSYVCRGCDGNYAVTSDGVLHDRTSSTTAGDDVEYGCAKNIPDFGKDQFNILSALLTTVPEAK